MYTKSYFGTPTEENLVQRILENCDFAVLASASGQGRHRPADPLAAAGRSPGHHA
jgi:hypothetical protein